MAQALKKLHMQKMKGIKVSESRFFEEENARFLLYGVGILM